MSKPLANSSLLLTDEQTDMVVAICRDGAQYARKAQGCGEDFKPGDMARPYSWMWWRQMASMSFDNNFKWRIRMPDQNGQIDTLWEKSNLTMNIPQDHLEQHGAEITGQILKDNRFFTYIPEGDEDELDPAINIIQRRLQYRAKKRGLTSILREAVQTTLICGEQIIKPSFDVKVSYDPQDVRILLDKEGKLAKASDGTYVTSADKWRPAADGLRDLLVKDPAITKKAGREPRMTDKTFKIVTPMVRQNGADFTLMHYEDVIIDPRWTSLDQANLIAHEFSWTLDQVLSFLHDEDVNEDALADYKNTAAQGSTYLASKDRAKRTHGEDVDEDERNQDAGEGSPKDEVHGRRRLREYYFKADILKVGRMQNLYAMIDVELDQLIICKMASETIPWNPELAHPYQCMRARKAKDRWYGDGYYHRMYDDLILIDRYINQIWLEIKNSGNVPFMDSSKIANVQATSTVRIRTDTPNVLAKGATVEEAFGVVTITPQIAEIEQSLNLALQRAAQKNGLAGAGGSVTQSLPSQETATGQQILENKSNAHVNQRIQELGIAVDSVVATFTQIELDNTDPDDLAEQVGDESALIMIDWVERNKDRYTDAIETLLTNITDSTTLQKNDQVIMVLEKWIAWPPMYQAPHKKAFIQLLRNLGVTDPEKYLLTANEIIAKLNEGQQAEQQQAAPPPTLNSATDPRGQGAETGGVALNVPPANNGLPVQPAPAGKAGPTQ